MNLLYDIATSLAAPAGAAWLAVRRGQRPLLRRFSPLTAPVSGHPVWVQACSVGELGAARPVLGGLRARRPDVPILLTTSTLTGYQAAPSACAEADVAFFPFDHRLAVGRFLRRAEPRALVLLETELWPAVIRETHRRRIPIVVLNARLSDKHYPRYLRLRPLLKPLFTRLTAVGVQNEEYAERFCALGTPPEAIHITGNIKFDGVRTEGREEIRARIRGENGFPPDTPLLLFGSTRPGDEALAAQCWRVLREEIPSLQLVVAPRHRERAGEALADFDEPVLRRSHVREGRIRAGERVFLLDTLGELADFYAAADLAVIGGSFYPGVNGHNPLEAAGFGVPCVFGPYMRNFIDPARVLVQTGGAHQVSGPGALLPALQALLADPGRCAEIGRRGRDAVLANQGATVRSLDLIDLYL